MGTPRREPLGKILEALGHLTPVELELGVATQAAWRRRSHEPDAWPLGRVLVRLGLVEPKHVAAALSVQAGLKVCYLLPKVEIEPEVIALVPREIAFREQIVPIKVGKRAIICGALRAKDFFSHDNLRFELGREVEFVILPEPHLDEAHAKYYGAPDPAPDPLQVHAATHLLRGAALRAQGAIRLDLRPEHLRLRCTWSGTAHDHELVIDRAAQEEALEAVGLGDPWSRLGDPQSFLELEVGGRRLTYLGEVERTDADGVRLTLHRLP